MKEKNKIMRIIHISDYHLDKKSANDSATIASMLSETLKSINNEKKIDLILYSGDMINTGGSSYDSIGTAFKGFELIFIDKILKTLNLPKNNFLFTIGNHDIDRNADSKYVEMGLSQTLTTEEEVISFYESKSEEGIKRVLPYKLFEKKFYNKVFSENDYYQSNYESCYKLYIDGLKIGVACLNSAWRCYDSEKDKGRILIGERQITNSYNFLKDCDVKIAISHHHYGWLAEFENTIIDKLLNIHFDIYFCGHTHSNQAEYCIKPDGKLFTFVAPGVLSKNKLTALNDYKNGFSLIDYNLEEAKATSTFYIQEYSSNFRINKEIGKNGVWEINIPVGEEAQKKMQMQCVILDIKEELSLLNEHLLSYNTASQAPKSLSEIFVMPNIVKRKDDIESDEKEDAKETPIKNLAEIISSKNNFVIFGTKEAGKTVLLDKILYDILNVVTGANLIPVLLDFNSIENDITINIRKCWKKNTNETNDLLLNDNIVLLIDNINFEIENINQIQNLSNFLKKFPKTRFIATSLQLYENNFSITPEQQSLLQFERLELKQFKAKQIKTLIQKWFPNSPQYETPKKMNTLINAFMSLNLPRTPFAVSMFLWIIERQQTYRPQNNATLIEKFIEEILDKKNIKGILRDTFDYENKIWLLAEIAHKMLISDQPNYSLPCSDIIKITERHLALRKFPKSYSARKIINGILNLGVFVEEDSVIRFRFNCFFEYFLVKKMETDPEFKKEVLDENNYLKYCNEINYYTGLHRGEAEILKNVVDRLEFDYITINDIVFSKVKSIDDFFHIDKSIVEQIKSEELFELLPDKKTEEESEKESDTKLEHSSDKKEGIIKKKHTNKFIAFGQLMLLAMNVLKNSEEIHEENLKADSYTRILKNSISYVVLYKMICEEIINHFEEFPKERVEEFKFVLRFLPVIHQNLISDNLGTYKLAEVIKEKIEADKVSGNKAVISEFEKFLSVYLYCDIKGDGYKAIMGDFIKNINKTYIADSCFFKLLAYYYSSTTPSDDNSIVNLLADLYIKVNANKNSNKRINKSALIQKFKKEKAELE